MSISTLPLSYCTNVHPGRTLDEVEQGLQRYTAPVQQQLDTPLAAGLWLARPVVDELVTSAERLESFAARLEELGLVCYTLNAFPYSDFHSDRVKEQVYIPDWSQPERLHYTLSCARLLASLMPEGTEGSISTVPLGFKQFKLSDDFVEQCIARLIELATRLDMLYDETGKLVRLALEPEPFCVLETTAEVISFFNRLRQRAEKARAADSVNRFLGLCYDVCHQAVEFEDVTTSIRALDQSDIRINKVHITCALELQRPAENAGARKVLAQYVEPRYLHQTMARTASGRVARAVDLTRELALEPDDPFREAECWRVHFHVPVDAERLGPLGTTRMDLIAALSTVSALPYAPHLEVETYTWEVMPGGRKADLVEGLTRELTATQKLLSSL